jgi:hypothetical protein
MLTIIPLGNGSAEGTEEGCAALFQGAWAVEAFLIGEYGGLFDYLAHSGR